ncbi:MAG TPA: ABC transporter ATP-binding protein [Nocardioides sp.]|jgi:oligopeptide/dipeptide ABC transporter ATP-binding protein|nr:ABC transporter ATP-binding protein [Nocardioides sp.]
MTPTTASTTDDRGRTSSSVLSIRNLTIATSGRRSTEVVSDVDLTVAPGEAVAIVGESGSGKSVTALSCLGLLPDGLVVADGSIDVLGTTVVGARESALRKIRGRDIAMVFQDPMTSLDPCYTVESQLVESVRAHRQLSKAEARRLAVEMLDMVEIPRAAERISDYPHEFSGGMRQRVMIAGALILRPRILVADEPTTALDVTTQASILRLVDSLRRELGMAVVWISHDLGVVAEVADRVAVMYAGEIVESATTSDLFAAPTHPYTRGLIDSATSRPRGEPFGYIGGKVPAPGEWGRGCRFAARCARATEICAEHPPLFSLDPGHTHRCVVEAEAAG